MVKSDKSLPKRLLNAFSSPLFIKSAVFSKYVSVKLRSNKSDQKFIISLKQTEKHFFKEKVCVRKGRDQFDPSIRIITSFHRSHEPTTLLGGMVIPACSEGSVCGPRGRCWEETCSEFTNRTGHAAA